MTRLGGPVRVLVVDDSAVMRQLLSTLLSADPDIEVVGTASDPYIARERIKALNPDVITLDVEMPKMDGLTFLHKIMTLRPTPVVMVSTLTQVGTEVTLEALEIGAVDFVAKQSADADREHFALEIQTKVKAAAHTRVGVRRSAPVQSAPQRIVRRAGNRIVFIGASTGGVEALKRLLVGIPADCPPILVTQHMPPRFTDAFAQRLNRELAMAVCEAKHDQPVEPGNVYIAPGAHHLEIGKQGTHYRCVLSDEAPVSGHRPSVDVLFRSAARVVGHTAVGVILTGMGKDGAEGMLELRKTGAVTFGQDEDSSLIYGMPRAAFECGAVGQQFSLDRMATAILDACEREAPPRAAMARHSTDAA
jgi:two-component system, chemotaxis family, protein-glutamate methylesterase/glutaminase